MALMGIYKITNINNNNCYIGQSIDIKTRWKSHRKHFGKTKEVETAHYPIYRAFKKYGKENFSFEIIEIVHDKIKLTERELYWYNTFNPEYNTLDPRNPAKTTHARPVLQIDMTTGEVLKRFVSTREAERELNLANVSKACNGKSRSCGGYLWCYEEEFSKEKTKLRPHRLSKPVNQYTIDGKLIKSFESIAQAERETKIKVRSIVKRLSKNIGGYIWEYADGGDTVPKTYKNKKKPGGKKK